LHSNAHAQAQAKEVQQYRQCHQVFHQLYQAYRNHKQRKQFEQDHLPPHNLIPPAHRILDEVQTKTLTTQVATATL